MNRLAATAKPHIADAVACIACGQSAGLTIIRAGLAIVRDMRSNKESR